MLVGLDSAAETIAALRSLGGEQSSSTTSGPAIPRSTTSSGSWSTASRSTGRSRPDSAALAPTRRSCGPPSPSPTPSPRSDRRRHRDPRPARTPVGSRLRPRTGLSHRPAPCSSRTSSDCSTPIGTDEAVGSPATSSPRSAPPFARAVLRSASTVTQQPRQVREEATVRWWNDRGAGGPRSARRSRDRDRVRIGCRRDSPTRRGDHERGRRIEHVTPAGIRSYASSAGVIGSRPAGPAEPSRSGVRRAERFGHSLVSVSGRWRIVPYDLPGSWNARRPTPLSPDRGTDAASRA